MKHAILLQVLGAMAGRGPLAVIDTHAGAGLYDLDAAPSRRSGEAAAGVGRLMAAEDAPAALALLVDAVRGCNPGGGSRWYPGSPTLAVSALQPGDNYLACELRGEEADALAAALTPLAARRGVKTRAVCADGYARAEAWLREGRSGLIFVDPPFEAGDDPARIARLAWRARGRQDVALTIWTPLKDLESFDALLRGLARQGLNDLVVAEVRLRPLDDPMRMNGCAVVMAGAPDISAAAADICAWTAERCGEAGGGSRVHRL